MDGMCFRLAIGVIKVDLGFTESIIYRHKTKRRKIFYDVHLDGRERKRGSGEKEREANMETDIPSEVVDSLEM